MIFRGVEDRIGFQDPPLEYAKSRTLQQAPRVPGTGDGEIDLRFLPAVCHRRLLRAVAFVMFQKIAVDGLAPAETLFHAVPVFNRRLTQFPAQEDFDAAK